MTAYDQIISRDQADDPLVPTPVSAEVIKEIPRSSAALSLCRTVPMSSKTSRMPVLSVLPQAYWVSGDTGLKSTSTADWENVTLVAEELAVIVPVPDAYVADSQVPIWNEVRPLIAQAFGAKLDGAVFFGTDKPATWGDDIFGSIPAGSKVEESATDTENITTDVAQLGQALAKQGFSLRGFAAEPGLNWKLLGLRDSTGQPVYAPNVTGAGPSTLYGRPFPEVDNGAWDSDSAVLIGGDFTKAIIGVRQDMTWKVLDQAVISDGDGKVILNLAQQDSVALRVVARFGYALANPVTALESDENARSPFAAVTPAAGAGS